MGGGPQDPKFFFHAWLPIFLNNKHALQCLQFLYFVITWLLIKDLSKIVALSAEWQRFQSCPSQLLLTLTNIHNLKDSSKYSNLDFSLIFEDNLPIFGTVTCTYDIIRWYDFHDNRTSLCLSLANGSWKIFENFKKIVKLEKLWIFGKL